MSVFRRSFSLQKGFTLIELLVVIGIIGILVAGVLVAIDPIEQFRKGADGTSKQAAATLSTALTAYYASNGELPWDTTGADCMSGSTPSETQVTAGTFNACVQELIDSGELKTSFTNQTDVLEDLYVTDATSGQRAAFNVCFDPQSLTDSENPQTTFDRSGTDNTCDNTTTDCFWCAN